MSISDIINWVDNQSLADLSHYFAIAFFGYLMVRAWWLKRSRNYWKSLVRLNTSKEVAELCGEQMRSIRHDVRKTLGEIKQEVVCEIREEIIREMVAKVPKNDDYVMTYHPRLPNGNGVRID